MVSTLKTDRCFEPYLPNENVTIEDVEEAYKEAVRDVHPDLEGHRKALVRVNKAADKLERLMKEDESYTIKPEKLEATGKYEKNKKEFKNVKEKLEEDISIRESWEKGLKSLENNLYHRYELVDYLRLREDLSVGRFENHSPISFSIEAQTDEELALFKMKYYVDDYGEVDEHKKLIFDSETEELEKKIRQIPIEAAEKAENIESKLYI